MNDSLEAAVNAFLQARVAGTAAFTPVSPLALHWYTSGFGGKMELPWIGSEVLDSHPLHPDTAVSEGQLKVTVETQADDESEAIHDARVNAVDAALRDWRASAAAISAASLSLGVSPVCLYGYALANRSRNLQDRHWTSALLYNVGFGPA